jgi:ABC-type transporter Mla subunit MlaD
MRTRKNRLISLRLLIIILILIFACLYILDFDLSIF